MAEQRWHFKFLWWPTRVGRTTVIWMETVARINDNGWDDRPRYRYGPVTNVLTAAATNTVEMFG